MTFRHGTYVTLTTIAPIAVVIATAYIAEAAAMHSIMRMHDYRIAFYAFVIIALCIETRVRMGYRLNRTMTFWIHLPAALLFFVLLGACAFLQVPDVVSNAVMVLFVIVLVTGIVLYTRGMRENLFSAKR